jgi:hypothetical protein
MQRYANVNSDEQPMAQQKQRIMTTSQLQLMIKANFHQSKKKQSGISDTLTNLHVKCQMPQA